MIQAWKNAETEMLANNPVVVNEELMTEIHGGTESAGKFCTVSAESTGTSCNTVGGVFDQIVKWIVD